MDVAWLLGVQQKMSAVCRESGEWVRQAERQVAYCAIHAKLSQWVSELGDGWGI